MTSTSGVHGQTIIRLLSEFSFILLIVVVGVLSFQLDISVPASPYWSMFLETVKLSVSVTALLFILLLQQSYSPALTKSQLSTWYIAAFLAVFIADSLFSLIFYQSPIENWFAIISLLICAILATAYLWQNHKAQLVHFLVASFLSSLLFYALTVDKLWANFLLNYDNLSPLIGHTVLLCIAILSSVSIVFLLKYGTSNNVVLLMPIVFAFMGYIEVFGGSEEIISPLNMFLYCLFVIFIIKSCLLLNTVATRFIAMMHSGMNSNPSIFLCGDNKRRLLFANDTFFELFGKQEANYLGDTRHPFLDHPLWSEINSKLQDGKSWSGETTVKDGGGALVAVHVNVSKVSFAKWTWHQISMVDLQEKVELQQETEDAKSRLEQLSFNLMEKQEEERRYFAKELHDEIGQGLTLLKIQHQLPEPDQQLITHVLSELIDKVRNLSLNLRPAILDDMGLSAALNWLIDRQGQFSELNIESQVSENLPRLEDKVEISVFRIAQEAFTNIHKYAHATRVKVKCGIIAGNLIFIIEDNGVGFDVDAKFNHAIKSQSLGLVSIKERALLVHGRITINSNPETGTSIRLKIPLPEHKENE